MLFRFVRHERQKPDRSVDLAFLNTRHEPDALVTLGPINELTVYRELLEVGFWHVHETEPEFALWPRLVARTQVDGLNIDFGTVAFDDTVWDEFMLIQLTDRQGKRYGWPQFGDDDRYRRKRREEIACEWGETIALARSRAESERVAALVQAREQSSPERRHSHLERILARLEELEVIIDQLRKSPSELRRGRGLPWETFAVWQGRIRDALREWAFLGGHPLVSCEKIGAGDLFRLPRKAKLIAVREAEQEVKDAIAAERADPHG